MNKIHIKRKPKWSIQAFDEFDQITMPEVFIKVMSRPAFSYKAVGDENGSRIQHVPGELFFYQVLDLNADSGFSKLKFAEESCLSFLRNVSKVILKYYDGKGEVSESWTFNEAKMRIRSIDDDPCSDCFDIEWFITYQKSEYQDHEKVKELSLSYTYDTVMDCGYFEGTREGLLHFPPPLADGTKQKPVLIPWDDLIDDSPQDTNNETHEG